MISTHKALFFALGAIFCFSIMGVLAKLAQESLSLWVVVFFRAFFTAIILVPAVFRERPFFGYRRGLLVLRGILGFTAISCFFFSVQKLRLVDATLLFQGSPFFVMLFSHVFLKEHSGLRDWIFMAIGFLGVTLVLKPTEGMISLYALTGLLAALAAGGAQTVIRALSSTERVSVIVFYFVSLTTVMTLPYTSMHLDEVGGTQLLVLLGLGIVGTMAQSLMTAAYQLQKARKIAIIKYLAVPLSAGWGFLLWSEVPDIWTLMGTIIVIGSLVLMEMTKDKSAQKEREKRSRANLSAENV